MNHTWILWDIGMIVHKKPQNPIPINHRFPHFFLLVEVHMFTNLMGPFLVALQKLVCVFCSNPFLNRNYVRPKFDNFRETKSIAHRIHVWYIFLHLP